MHQRIRYSIVFLSHCGVFAGRFAVRGLRTFKEPTGERDPGRRISEYNPWSSWLISQNKTKKNEMRVLISATSIALAGHLKFEIQIPRVQTVNRYRAHIKCPCADSAQYIATRHHVALLKRSIGTTIAAN